MVGVHRNRQTDQSLSVCGIWFVYVYARSEEILY